MAADPRTKEFMSESTAPTGGLSDPPTRARIKDELFNWGRMITYKGRDMLSVIQISNYQPDSSFEGKNLRQILDMRGTVPSMSNGKELAMEIA